MGTYMSRFVGVLGILSVAAVSYISGCNDGVTRGAIQERSAISSTLTTMQQDCQEKARSGVYTAAQQDQVLRFGYDARIIGDALTDSAGMSLADMLDRRMGLNRWASIDESVNK